MRGKRTLSCFLVLALVLAFLPHAHAFYDTVGSPAEDAIQRWNDYGVILGYDGYFRPDDSITRAEMATIIDRIGSYPAADENHYRDLGEGWYTEPVLKVSAAGIILGYDGYVRPFDTITRAEAVIMLARTFSIGEDASGISVFRDADSIPAWAEGFVGAMALAGVLPFGDTFRQAQAITRSEVVQILDALLGAVYNEPGVYTDSVDGSALISSSDVVLRDATVTGDVYIAGAVTNISLSGATVLGQVYYMAGPEDVSVELPGSGEPEPEPFVYTGDMAVDFDLSHTGSEVTNITFYGGQSLAVIFEKLESRHVCDAADLYAFCQKTDLSRYYDFLAGAYENEDCLFPLEGYIVPGAYDFHFGSTPALVVKTLLDAAAETMERYAVRSEAMGYSLHELLTISSIIEKEVGGTTEPDRATVASVIYNRLEKGSRLQMNVTRNYLDAFPEELGIDTERYADAYNTYSCPALPAGPICSPRAECVEAALNPYDTDYIFFRSDSYGNIYYAETYEEHLQYGEIANEATAYLGYLGYLTAGVTPVVDPDLDFLSDTDYSGITIMLDAGHGGSDVGAYIEEIAEKDINLSVTLMVRDLLQARGACVLMTRTGDTYSSPEERAELANAMDVDLYLSIHCNSTEDKPDITGIETYVCPGAVAGRDWATVVQRALIRATGAVDRGIKEEKLLVLRKTNMPAILVELGFMSNETELRLLLDIFYQQQLAQAIAEGTFIYLDSLR